MSDYLQGEVRWPKSHLGFYFEDCVWAHFMYLCVCAPVIPDRGVITSLFSLQHLPLHLSRLQSSPEAVTSFVSHHCDGDATTSKTDVVSALLERRPLFLECLLYVKGFPYTIAFTFHNSSMK